ncbi:alkylated DNA repair protein ALKBH8 homolog isoform X2 [Macadamia integrifolia]|uniref:alkylated DNA repair protein ALKBH8 homolog isoform X2 n=1 Tax=Macadamia integrifolia TaxID=60698 RepID=UPI001C4EED3F|nr:alkylated DNA repair protein ALKBH8 homolog isoform X2 [Macadamia integrifolia]
MGTSRFTRPKGLDGESTPNLFVANCGPAVGLSLDEIASAFCKFGEVCGVYPADESGARVIVSYSEVGSAQAALKALDGHSCSDLGGRVLHIRNSILRPPSQELLAAVDGRPWKSLSKRRVQHYGYEFLYEARNVNTEQQLGELPHFVSPILEKISLFPHIEKAEDVTLDQLTVNEYPPGVGLSPHIDTHSTFEGLIFSLSLAGPCIMEFRRYSQGTWLPSSLSSTGMQEQNPDYCSSFTRRSIFLPPRSMLLLSGEGRYAWHHYIPHHKVDMVRDNMIRRGSRRVSFTFRKVRAVPCQCEFPQYCDSQK